MTLPILNNFDISCSKTYCNITNNNFQILKIEEISNDNQCLGECSVIYNITPSVAFTMPNQFNKNFTYTFLSSNITSYTFELNATKIINRTIGTCNINNSASANGTNNTELCSSYVESFEIGDWRSTNLTGEVFLPFKSYLLRIKAVKKITSNTSGGLQDNTQHFFTAYSQNLTNLSWFNTSFSYRRNITIGNISGVNLSNYAVLFLINTSSFTTAKINGSCQDVRFTYYNQSANTEAVVPYWIQNCTTLDNSTLSRFWVNVSFINSSQSNTTVFMYYGSSSAINTSSINNTFIFGEDWEANDTSIWSQNNTGINSFKWNNTQKWMEGNGTGTSLISPTTQASLNNYIVESDIYYISTTGNGSGNFGNPNNIAPSGYIPGTVVNLSGGLGGATRMDSQDFSILQINDNYYNFSSRTISNNSLYRISTSFVYNGSMTNITSNLTLPNGTEVQITRNTTYSIGGNYGLYFSFASIAFDNFRVRAFNTTPLYIVGAEQNVNVAPIVSILAPLNGTYVRNSSAINITVNCTDNVSSTMAVSLIVNSTNMTFNGSVLNSTSTILSTNANMQDGTYNIYASCDDRDTTSNLVANSTNITVFVDLTVPNINATVNATYVQLGYPIAVNMNNTDAISWSNASIQVYDPNGNLVENKTLSVSPAQYNLTLNTSNSTGNYTINISSRDSAGNIQNQTNLSFGVFDINYTLDGYISSLNYTSNADPFSVGSSNISRAINTSYYFNISVAGNASNVSGIINFNITKLLLNYTNFTVYYSNGTSIGAFAFDGTRNNFTFGTGLFLNTSNNLRFSINSTSTNVYNYSMAKIDTQKYNLLFITNITKSFNTTINFTLPTDMQFAKTTNRPRYFVCTSGITRGDVTACNTFTAGVDVTSSNNGANTVSGYAVNMFVNDTPATVSQVFFTADHSTGGQDFLIQIQIVSGGYSASSGGGGGGGGGGGSASTTLAAGENVTSIVTQILCSKLEFFDLHINECQASAFCKSGTIFDNSTKTCKNVCPDGFELNLTNTNQCFRKTSSAELSAGFLTTADPKLGGLPPIIPIFGIIGIVAVIGSSSLKRSKRVG